MDHDSPVCFYNPAVQQAFPVVQVFMTSTVACSSHWSAKSMPYLRMERAWNPSKAQFWTFPNRIVAYRGISWHRPSPFRFPSCSPVGRSGRAWILIFATPPVPSSRSTIHAGSTFINPGFLFRLLQPLVQVRPQWILLSPTCQTP